MDKKAWIASIVTLGIIDFWAAYIKKDGTLSQAARQTFRTDTRPGKLAWALTWGSLTAWLVPHIWKNADSISEAIGEVADAVENLSQDWS